MVPTLDMLLNIRVAQRRSERLKRSGALHSLVSLDCLVVCILDGILECNEATRMDSFAKVCFLSGRTEYFFRTL